MSLFRRSRVSRKRLRCYFRRPSLFEVLESRCLLATVAWDGGGDGTRWTDQLNWDSDLLPQPSDQVVIPSGRVQLDTDAAVASLEILGTGRLDLVNTTLTTDLTLAGVLAVYGDSFLNGALTTSDTSHIAVRGTATAGGFVYDSRLTVQQGFTNLGLITLRSEGSVNIHPVDVGDEAHLSIAAGTLVNQGTIQILAPGGNYAGLHDIEGPVDNRGSVTIEQDVRWDSNWTNSGTVTVGQYVRFGETRLATLEFETNSVTWEGGTIEGVGSVLLDRATLDLQSDLTNTLSLSTHNTSLVGPATLTNAAGATLFMYHSTYNTPVRNEGTLIVRGDNQLSGNLTTTGTSRIDLHAWSTVNPTSEPKGESRLRVANSFTNLGEIRLLSSGRDAISPDPQGDEATLVLEAGAVVANEGTIRTIRNDSLNYAPVFYDRRKPRQSGHPQRAVRPGRRFSGRRRDRARDLDQFR